MGETTTQAPVIRCPKCGKEWVDYAYFEVTYNSELHCSGCDSTLVLDVDECVRYWSFKVKP